MSQPPRRIRVRREGDRREECIGRIKAEDQTTDNQEEEVEIEDTEEEDGYLIRVEEIQDEVNGGTTHKATSLLAAGVSECTIRIRIKNAFSTFIMHYMHS